MLALTELALLRACRSECDDAYALALCLKILAIKPVRQVGRVA
jgi:hypothetical protein